MSEEDKVIATTAAPDAAPVPAPATAAKKVTLRDALAMNQACVTILSGPIQVPKKFGWALMRNRDRTQPLLENYDKMRRDLLDKYAEKKDDGSIKTDQTGQASFATHKDREDFAKEHEELMEFDTAVDFYRIPFSAIPENITANVLMGIDPAVDENA